MAGKKHSPYFFFKNKDSPDYVGFYGTVYTDRQLAILNGEIPLSEVRPNELSFLYKKASLTDAFYFNIPLYLSVFSTFHNGLP